MKAYEVSAVIQASPEVSWAIITDAPGLSRWDSGIEQFANGLKKEAEAKAAA